MPPFQEMNIVHRLIARAVQVLLACYALTILIRWVPTILNLAHITVDWESRAAFVAIDIEVTLGILLPPLMAVTFIAWFTLSYYHLAKHNSEYARFGAWWGLYGLLIPGANIVLPLMIMNDLWRSAHSNGANRRPYTIDNSRRRRASVAVTSWWILLWLDPVFWLAATSFVTEYYSNAFWIRIVDIARTLAWIPDAILGIALIQIVSFARIRVETWEATPRVEMPLDPQNKVNRSKT